MYQPYFSLCFKYTLLAIEAQQVIALRMMRVAAGGPRADREMRRMVSEKAVAIAQIGLETATAMAAGQSGGAIAHSAVRGYRKRVRANRRRLSPI